MKLEVTVKIDTSKSPADPQILNKLYALANAVRGLTKQTKPVTISKKKR